MSASFPSTLHAITKHILQVFTAAKFSGCAVGKKITSVQFCKKKLQFLVRFRFYKINRGFGFSVRLGLRSSVDVDAIFHLRLYGMMLEMTYFRAELVQQIISWSDSELEVQRYGMKKNTSTVDAIMLQDKLWMRQHEKPSPNWRSRFFENWTAEIEFSVFEFWGRFGF